MIEIDHSLLDQDVLMNLISEVVARHYIYGEKEVPRAIQQQQLLHKLQNGEASIVYYSQDGFCDIISSDTLARMQNDTLIS